jgi:hypothetical protein
MSGGHLLRNLRTRHAVLTREPPNMAVELLLYEIANISFLLYAFKLS